MKQGDKSARRITDEKDIVTTIEYHRDHPWATNNKAYHTDIVNIGFTMLHREHPELAEATPEDRFRTISGLSQTPAKIRAEIEDTEILLDEADQKAWKSSTVTMGLTLTSSVAGVIAGGALSGGEPLWMTGAGIAAGYAMKTTVGFALDRFFPHRSQRAMKEAELKEEHDRLMDILPDYEDTEIAIRAMLDNKPKLLGKKPSAVRQAERIILNHINPNS